MATVAVLNVAVKASTGGFERSMRGVVATLGGLPGAIAAVATKASLLAGVFTNSARATDRMSETARRLGMSTDAFSRISFAAGQLGTDTEDVATKLMRLNKNIGTVSKAGKGPLKSAFRDLGISFERFVQLGSEEQLIELADGFSRVRNRADRTRIAFDLFGKSGASVLNMFTEGGVALRTMFQEADKLGITVRQLDASKAEMLVDLAEKFRLRWEGIKRSIASRFLPLLIAIGDVLLGWSTSTDGWGNTLTGWLDVIIDGFAELFRLSDLIQVAWSRLVGTMQRIQMGVLNVAKSIAAALLALEGSAEPTWIGNWIKGLRHVSDALDAMGKKDLLGGISHMVASGAAEMGAFALEGLSSAIGFGRGLISPRRQLLETAVDEMDQRARDLEKSSTDLFDKAAEEFTRAWSATHPAVNAFREAVDRVQQAARDAAERAREAAGGPAAEMEARLGKASPAIGAAIFGTEEVIEAMRKAANPSEEIKLFEAQLFQQKQMNENLKLIQKALEKKPAVLF